MENLDQYINSYNDSFPYRKDNESVGLIYAQELVKSCQRMNGMLEVCSLGIGTEIVSKEVAKNLQGKIQKYTIIEGSRAIIEKYKNNNPPDLNCKIICDYFENFDQKDKFDLIEMGFVLEHVDSPDLLVKKFSQHLKSGGVICAAVPNALSMHRVLGMRAGILKDPYQLNEWDLKLGHKRYFDTDIFRTLFEKNGMKIVREAGLMLKPFSTEQINSLNLSDSVWNALCLSGDIAPRYAYGIYIEAMLSN